jgi:methyltransferase (TIGR00027 family)
MAKAAAKTGVGPTLSVAIEQSFPRKQRIIEDDLAYKILPAGMRFFVKLLKSEPIRDLMISTTEKKFPGIWGGVMCRKRYIDEKLTDLIDQIKSIVILGAGFDTRAYRLASLSDCSVWEADQHENIYNKQTRLIKLFGRIPFNVKLVAIDFDYEDILNVLESNGYCRDQKTFFIMEAVTQYLTEAGIRSVFDFLSHVASGSALIFTYILKDFLKGKQMYGCESLYNRYINGKIWIFGMNPGEWTDFLYHYGWKVIEDVDFSRLHDKYIRPTGRKLAWTPVERVIYAEKI